MFHTEQTRIGLPRALLYHKYAHAWTQFFSNIGCRVITSPDTNRHILEQGIRYSIDETCLAVKIYLGHIQYLIDKVDYLFIPRIVSLYPDEEACVKLFALGDIVRNTFEGVQILEYTVDVADHQYESIGLFKLGLRLNHNPIRVLNAYRLAMKALVKHKQTQLEKQAQQVRTGNKSAMRVLLVAHSYVTYDALLGKPIVQFLRDQAVDILFSDVVEEHAARMLSKQISTDLYWSYNKQLLGAIERYREDIDGIIFLLAFPCGPDSLVISLCQHKLTDIPLCVLTLDELQGDAGIKTRLESFIDILQFKKDQRI